MTGGHPNPVRVGIIGMGYVGLTLAAALADKGFEIHGVEVQETVLDSLRRGRPHIFEPGVEEVFSRLTGSRIFVDSRLPVGGVDVAVICVSTPVDLDTHEPYVKNIEAAARHIAEVCSPDTLVVIRSTVPVGTSREVVLPPLRDVWGEALLVMAPERTIQGQALRELVELPQVVGGLDERSLARGVEFFGGLARQVVPVSTLETAELVKLTNNCHTDVIYAFGNEVAMTTERLGLDPLEVIRATNLDYPRPDIAKPGYVGGGCLSKDPYIMLAGSARGGHTPELIRQARALNEELPAHVARRIVDLLGEVTGVVAGRRLAVLGWAYKGWPPTDDMRGTPIATMMPIFEAAGVRVVGHDPLVGHDVIRAHGGEPVDVATAFATSDTVLVITDHPDYRRLDVATLLAGSPVRLVFDSWRILDDGAVRAHGVRYAGLGYEPRAPEAAFAQARS
ncbi:MAG: nucleotide sugar dehydrogenase [Kineosporiaceae bacterium]